MTRKQSEKELEINAVVDSMIPATNGEERFWETAAREVLRGVLAYCHKCNLRSDAELWQAVNSSVAEIRDMCGATPLGQRGYSLIGDPGSWQARAIHAHLVSCVSCQKGSAGSGHGRHDIP